MSSTITRRGATPRRVFAVLLAAPLALLTLAAVGCGPRVIGYGLFLWADPQGPFATGQVVPVVQESTIQKSFLVRPTGSKELVEVPAWRLRLVEDRQQAAAQAEAYRSFLDTYAYSQRDGLPLREAPDSEARRVYKLREGQLVKVVSRGEDKVQVAGYEDYWYQVLTADGALGYCFGAYLPVFTSQGDPQEEVQRLRARDPLLEALLSTTWRPEYFQEMADSGRVDLARFTPEIGLFVDQETRSVRLVLPRLRRTFRYSDVENVAPNRYVFVGTDLRVNMQSDRRLVLSYTVNGQLLSAVYVDFQGDMEEILTRERERRQELYESFTSRGRVLQSSAYGTITLREDMGFLWKGFGRLQAMVFGKPVSGAGVVDFPYGVSPQLAGRYDGAVAFRFQEYGPEESSTFLYRFDPSGVRLEFVRPENIEDQEVRRSDVTPVVIYFTFGGS